MNFLFVGDVVGKGGRMALKQLIPQLRQEFNVAFVIVNGENMANGNGFTKKCLEELKEAEIDIFTGGDHMWDQKEFVTDIISQKNVLRPANLCESQPGIGYKVCPIPIGGEVLVISVLGRVFMKHHVACPFLTVDRILQQHPRVKMVIVDMHAEATSEKIALGRYLDGRVSAVLGTHTHVETADEQIFAGGTAFQCDVGMVGAKDSILGRDIEPVVKSFTTGMMHRFTVNESNICLHGTLVNIDRSTGKAISIQRICRDYVPES